MATPSAGRLPFDARRSLFIYNCFFPLVFVALLPGFLRRMLRRGNYRESFGQRLGLYQPGDGAVFQDAAPVWIHSISVGETLVALKLARELLAADPAVRIALTVTTTTGFALGRQSRSNRLEVFYNPIDLRLFVRRALDFLRPSRVIFIEGEAWPNLLAACVRRGIPTALVNARLSPRSESRFRRFRAFTGPVFRLLDLVCVPECVDIARWQSLGVAVEKLRHTGSIKFDVAGQEFPERAAQLRALIEPLGISAGTPVLVAGSTWAPEEKALCELLVTLRREFPGLFLILVPRHAERVPALLGELAPAGLRIVRRSTLPVPATELPSTPPDLLLVDTTGELRDWYQLATVVFVGKSLPGVSEAGGQNPAEPAALGKPVVFGPHMENFASVVELLLSRNAALQVSDAAALPAAFSRLLSDPSLCAAMALNAQSALQSHQGATRRVGQSMKDEV